MIYDEDEEEEEEEKKVNDSLDELKRVAQIVK
jgi:hypothetical protein